MPRSSSKPKRVSRLRFGHIELDTTAMRIARPIRAPDRAAANTDDSCEGVCAATFRIPQGVGLVFLAPDAQLAGGTAASRRRSRHRSGGRGRRPNPAGEQSPRAIRASLRDPQSRSPRRCGAPECPPECRFLLDRRSAARRGTRTRADRGTPGRCGHPVEPLSWTECTDAASRLGLMLPTEARWEYATRAGAPGRALGWLGPRPMPSPFLPVAVRLVSTGDESGSAGSFP